MNRLTDEVDSKLSDRQLPNIADRTDSSHVAGGQLTVLLVGYDIFCYFFPDPDSDDDGGLSIPPPEAPDFCASITSIAGYLSATPHQIEVGDEIASNLFDLDIVILGDEADTRREGAVLRFPERTGAAAANRQSSSIRGVVSDDYRAPAFWTNTSYLVESCSHNFSGAVYWSCPLDHSMDFTFWCDTPAYWVSSELAPIYIGLGSIGQCADVIPTSFDSCILLAGRLRLTLDYEDAGILKLPIAPYHWLCRR